jgi:signal transduction histidine kinase
VSFDLGRADEKDDDFAGLVEMAAGAGHELNNPLSVISGRAQLLIEGESDAGKIEGLKKIQQNSEALSQIIVNLLSFAEPKAPKATKVEAGQIIEEAIQLVMMKKSVSESDFVVVNELEEGQAVFVDSGQIASAIANILHNAIEACGEKLRPVEINVGGGESGDIVSIVITDHGCGMDSDTIAKATHPFFSGKKAGRQRGMGLANARRLIELNKGTLSFDSMVGRGTSVVVELPLG